MPSGEKGFEPGTRSRGGKREGAGRKPKSIELIEIKIAAENVGKLVDMIPDALQYVHGLIKGDKKANPDRTRLEAAKVVLDKMLPDSLVAKVLERNMLPSPGSKNNGTDAVDELFADVFLAFDDADSSGHE